MATQLFAPPEYWKLTDEERKNFDCGPGRGILTMLVPNRILGCDIKPACDIHDFMYGEGKTNEDKDTADRVFRNNLIRLIESASGSDSTKKARLVIAREYFEAVHHFGGVAFWRGKNKPEEMGSSAA